MVAAYRKTYWRFTLVENDFNYEKGIHAFPAEQTINKKVDNHEVQVELGCIEQEDENNNYPHIHGLIFAKGAVLTKGRAKELLANVLGIELPVGIFFKPCEKVSDYRVYMFKQKRVAAQSTHLDKVIREAVAATKDVPIPKNKAIPAYITKTKGITYTTRNDRVIKNALNQPELMDPRAVLKVTVDYEKNFNNTKLVVKEFQKNVSKQLAGGSFSTGCLSMAGYSNTDIKNYVTCMALLPNLVVRCEEVDNLPSVAFWGVAGSGKSFLFNTNAHYRQIATDSDGVGKWKLTGDERAFLLDDWPKHLFVKAQNSATIRQIALGGTATVKVFGDTFNAKGFLMVTSNDKPIWLCSPDELDEKEPKLTPNNIQAMHRRFVCVQFVEEYVSDFVWHIYWNHDSAKEAAFQCLYWSFQKLPPGVIKNSIKVYVDHIESSYGFGTGSEPGVKIMSDSLGGSQFSEGEYIFTQTSPTHTNVGNKTPTKADSGPYTVQASPISQPIVSSTPHANGEDAKSPYVPAKAGNNRYTFKRKLNLQPIPGPCKTADGGAKLSNGSDKRHKPSVSECVSKLERDRIINKDADDALRNAPSRSVVENMPETKAFSILDLPLKLLTQVCAYTKVPELVLLYCVHEKFYARSWNDVADIHDWNLVKKCKKWICIPPIIHCYYDLIFHQQQCTKSVMFCKFCSNTVRKLEYCCDNFGISHCSFSEMDLDLHMRVNIYCKDTFVE